MDLPPNELRSMRLTTCRTHRSCVEFFPRRWTWNLDDVCRINPVSEATFMRCYRRYRGLSPRSHLLTPLPSFRGFQSVSARYGRVNFLRPATRESESFDPKLVSEGRHMAWGEVWRENQRVCRVDSICSKPRKTLGKCKNAGSVDSRRFLLTDWETEIGSPTKAPRKELSS